MYYRPGQWVLQLYQCEFIHYDPKKFEGQFVVLSQLEEGKHLFKKIKLTISF